MNIEILKSYECDENCYIVFDEKNQGFIVDPGCDGNEIIDFANKKGIKILNILLTHCHYDHIMGLEKVRKETGAKVVSSFECNLNIQNSSINLSRLFGDELVCGGADIIVTDNEEFYVGDFKIKAIHTPGHTNGGMCYLVGDDLFSGDTLFLRSIGRSDFPTGSTIALENSIRNKIYKLDDDIIVHPGHGNDTKIYYEKRYNMYVKM